MVGRMEGLLEVFQDVKPTYTARGYARKRGERTYGAYTRLYEVVPKEPSAPLTVERLRAYAEKLGREHPEFRFWVESVEVEGRKLHVIRRSEKPLELESLEGEASRLRAEADQARSRVLSLQQQLERVEKEIDQIRGLPRFRRLLKALRLLRLRGWQRRLFEEVRSLRLRHEALDKKLFEAMEKLKALEAMAQEAAKPWMPIYFELTQNKVYIEEALWRENPRLYVWVIRSCLGWLGMATTQHRGYVH
jgi:hypothetical protein